MRAPGGEVGGQRGGAGGGGTAAAGQQQAAGRLGREVLRGEGAERVPVPPVTSTVVALAGTAGPSAGGSASSAVRGPGGAYATSGADGGLGVGRGDDGGQRGGGGGFSDRGR